MAGIVGISSNSKNIILNLIICFSFPLVLIACDSEEALSPDQLSESSSAQVLRQARINTAFTPSLGINTEAAQPESAIVADALMFVDLFRTARPFQELSTGITVDEHGWPTSIASDGVARTYMMQNIPAGSIPYGDYIMLYEGSGEVGFSSNVTVKPLPTALLNQGYQGRTVTISPSTQQINMVVTGISEGDGNYVKNIRLLMPGGVCGTNTHVWVANAASCSDGQPYQSFVDKLKQDRNQIVFNPDYLNFMKDFNTIRLMNLLGASPGRSHCLDGDNPGQLITSCISHAVTWEDRPQLSDAAWGGSAKTSLSTESYVTNPVSRQGVPIEVAVELVNQLNINPWFNMHHAADDDYIKRFAEYIYQNLSEDLQVYIEYSNEVWNSGFIGFHYAQIKGIEQGFNTIPDDFQGSSNRDSNYFARLRYYSKRSVEVFDFWEAAFKGTDRLTRTLSGFQGDTVLSEQILAFQKAAENLKVDALAIAPYFSGCIVAEFDCANAPMLMPDVQTVDDVFAVIDWAPAPNGLQGILRKIEQQAEIANTNNVSLVAYEGGQNLVVTGSFPTLADPFENQANKERLRALFFDANRDPRMKQRYLDLLNGWHALADKGTELFTLYTQPQSYYQFGSWGIKESLQQDRTNAPKYDAAMTFQETVETPWWLSARNMEAALSAVVNYMLVIDQDQSSNKPLAIRSQQRSLRSAATTDTTIEATNSIPTPDELYERQTRQNKDVTDNDLPATLPDMAVVSDALKALELLDDNTTPTAQAFSAEPLADDPDQSHHTETAGNIVPENSEPVVPPALKQLEQLYDSRLTSGVPTLPNSLEGILYDNPSTFEASESGGLHNYPADTNSKAADFE